MKILLTSHSPWMGLSDPRALCMDHMLRAIVPPESLFRKKIKIEKKKKKTYLEILRKWLEETRNFASNLMKSFFFSM